MREFWTEYFHEDKIVTLQSDTGGARASLSPHLGVAPAPGSSYFASVPLTPPSRPLSGFCPNSPWKLEQFLGVDWNGATWGSSKFGHGQVGNGGLSFRYRHVLYNCIDWLDDGTQHGSSGNRSVLWDWRWQRNEDAIFCKCMSGKGSRGGDARIEDWRPAWRPETRLHYKVASMCLANKWSQEHTALDAMSQGQPPPFGLHAICRSIASFGQCEEVVGAERGPTRPGDPPRIGSFACRRAGFSVDRTFDAWTQYCGADLNYMRVCTDYRGGESGG
jgi:hypothetical protein